MQNELFPGFPSEIRIYVLVGAVVGSLVVGLCVFGIVRWVSYAEKRNTARREMMNPGNNTAYPQAPHVEHPEKGADNWPRNEY